MVATKHDAYPASYKVQPNTSTASFQYLWDYICFLNYFKVVCSYIQNSSWFFNCNLIRIIKYSMQHFYMSIKKFDVYIISKNTSNIKKNPPQTK